ncbi:hypothetical protein [Parasitella parasitica]|uniref:Transcription regulator Rua1 C-terminal domain-containing protein n=1 Tax=Parasitella parasitica TaxID=35722 RepID=A0A0B7N0N7_9FUNG|nr:hypothetical protein [Parasitella parasitica]
MDIQGYLPAKEKHSGIHYAERSNDRINLPSTPDYTSNVTATSSTSNLPKILPTLVEEEDGANAEATASVSYPIATMVTSTQGDATIASCSSSSSQDQQLEIDQDGLNPALLLNRYDKRKSSPAILGLPFGLNHEAQLSLHLSQQRNSIEAAMLLANFNKLMAFPKANEVEHKVHPQQQQWQDDMSIPSQNKSAWGDVLINEAESNRRHSYDVNMSWQTMPEAFLERPDLLHKAASPDTSANATASSSSSSVTFHTVHSDVPVFKQENLYSHHTPTKVSWSHDDLHQLQSQHPHHQQQQTQHPYSSVEYSNHPISPRQHGRLYHPTMSSPLVPHTYHHRYPPHPQQQQSQPLQQQPEQLQHHHHSGGVSMLHPLARQPDVSNNSGVKRELEPQQSQQQHPYYSYTFPPQNPMQQRYYYPSNGKLPLPTHQSMESQQHPHQQQQQQQQQQQHASPIISKPKRKKQKSSSADEFDEEMEQEANEEDYPDMSARDVDAARTDPEARPRKQKLRFAGDKYTPQWVRYNGQSKEGLCDTCKPGKWLQLKNSAYWYHKQFFHGISSVSGKEFVQPLETRWVDQDLVEGLCHQCHTWVA